jgi:hypothetical protein
MRFIRKEPVMNSNRWMIIILCVMIGFALMGLEPRAWAFGTELSRSSLEGHGGVSVRAVGHLEPEIEEKLTLDKIRTNVEAQLQGAGITILSDLEFLETKERPLLSVKINTLKQGDGYIFSVIAQFFQHVYLIREGQSKTYPAATWSSDGVIGIFYNLEDLQDLVKGEVDAFIQAFPSATSR